MSFESFGSFHFTQLFLSPPVAAVFSLHRLSLPLMLLQRWRLDGGCRAFRGFHQSARGVLLGQIQEPFLASHQRLAALDCNPPKAAVRGRLTRLSFDPAGGLWHRGRLLSRRKTAGGKARRGLLHHRR